MSSQVAKELLDADVEFVGGVAYIDHKEVGHWQNGEFYEEPGMEDIIAQHKARVKNQRALIMENARLAAEAAAPTPAKGTVSKVTVPDEVPTISVADAATKTNSIPGTGPANPVRVDGDNNRTPEVTDDTTPKSAEEVLRALDNTEGAAAVAKGEKQAAGTGTELGGKNIKPR